MKYLKFSNFTIEMEVDDKARDAIGLVVLPIAGFIPNVGDKEAMSTLRLWLSPVEEPETYRQLLGMASAFYNFIRKPKPGNTQSMSPCELIVKKAGEILSKKDTDTVQAMMEKIRDAKSAIDIDY